MQGMRESAPAVFGRRQWAFPVAVLLHNSEEWFWMPRWVEKHGDQLPWVVTVEQFRFGLIVLTLAAFAVTYLSARRGKQSIWAYLLFGYIWLCW